MPTKAQVREQQLQAALKAVTERPGSTVYAVGLAVDPLAPMTLILSLLNELEKDGKVRAEDDPKGQRCYPVQADGQD